MPASCAKALAPTIALFGWTPTPMISVSSWLAGKRCSGVDAGRVGELVGAGLQDHDDLLERAVAGPLADAVDRALDLARAVLDGAERVGDGEAEIVVAVDADDGRLAERARDLSDERAVLLGDAVADGVGDVDRGGARGDDRARDLDQIFDRRAPAVLGGELDVADVLAGERHRGRRLVQHLRARLLQLVLEVDVAGRQEDVDAGRRLRALERLGRPLDVERGGARQRRDLDRDLAAHLLHRLEVAVRRDGEPRLHDVHAQLGELVGHAQLLGHGHAAAGGLLAIAQGGVEDMDSVAGSAWTQPWVWGADFANL